MKAMNIKNTKVEKMTEAELDQVSGGIAWIDDFIIEASQAAGKFLKNLFHPKK